ncbi:MAG: hypothetical protein RSC93_02760 [Erysipelotrichaceae bacterium]
MKQTKKCCDEILEENETIALEDVESIMIETDSALGGIYQRGKAMVASIAETCGCEYQDFENYLLEFQDYNMTALALIVSPTENVEQKYVELIKRHGEEFKQKRIKH